MVLPFRTESWIWYSLGVFIVACRFLSRGLLFKSIKKFQVDDWLMFVVLCTDTVFMVAINICAHTSSNLLAPGEDVNQFTPQERAERIYGSKIVLVVEQMQCCTIWLIKACLLILYNRLTQQLRANIAVKILAVYVGVGFVVMEILYFGVWCRPFHNYWALPTPNPQCDAATNHLITNAVLNISSDLIMLCIAFTLFGRSRLPLNRKAILCGIFSLGVFVILAAILNKYYSFTHPFGSQWTYWYVRESSTAILVANLPFTWTLLRRIFNLKSFDSGTMSEIPWHSSRSAMGRNPAAHPGRRGRTQKSPTGGQTAIPMGNGGFVTSGVALKHGSQSSKASETEELEFGQRMPPPTVVKAPEMTMAKPPHAPSYWRNQSVYGRADLDALDVDPWDCGSEGASIMIGLSPSVRASRAPTIRTTAAAERPQSPPSPVGNRGRRIKDQEEMLKMQDGLRYHYQGIDEE